MNKIYVIAAPGLKVPTEFDAHKYVTDQLIVPVEDSAYYQRRITDGDLQLSTQKAFEKQSASEVK